MDDKTLKDIKSRLSRLEKVVFNNVKKNFKNPPKEKFTGPKGGLELLISRGFFNKIRNATETMQELSKNNYVYRREVVQTALNRLSGKKGPLVSFKEKGTKVYVIRK